ncbi:MAG: bacteriochlorophyll 4-vinyl reductase [Geminicoccaceae bacterium]|nr:MAG: bacteriochlorophyll 4-vinyl reductase [Geminicoccaceae bacterium]
MTGSERAGSNGPARPVSADADDPIGRIGPNAITRLVEAIGDREGADRATAVLRDAGLDAYIEALPQRMVDEAHVAALYRAAVAALGEPLAVELAAEAGKRTGDYLLAHRIPKPAQALLRVLPPSLASFVLLKAIGRHAWTFTGSGRLVVGKGHPLPVDIVGGAIAAAGPAAGPLARFYAATFQRLYRELVSPRSTVEEHLADVEGTPACRLRLAWR